ncbi:MAG: hypothetical protein GTN89_08015 [Acidobacteria bacterium]|nr:hypothetical protein [Acidobacteriota bacterium]NIM63688.1 hypothetical protein [Acidobacteriota bacterium]NIO59291.1 hypothetical protein [Acidobacteriota bacterium]NIQ30303.1 hypothetical protein [Acidobacteriota bacterium]NIQ85246.1 hypothetical protein [Acidobacteriota bacterium]
MSGAVRHYLFRSGAVAAALAVLLALLFALRGAAPIGFALLGWAPMALLGVGGGAWAVSRFGRPGPAFPLAVLTCILLRLVLGLGGLALAAWVGQVVAYLAGSLATFATMQAFEMVWFWRRNRLDATASATLTR